MSMRELVVISGKGGTGKTSIVASFAALAEPCVLADCDVDAADLHLLLAPTVQRREAFQSGHEAVIRQEDCNQCGVCQSYCRFDAIVARNGEGGTPALVIKPLSCEGCGVCVHFCPAEAIDFPERTCGEWYVSDTRFGPLVHARLGIGAENSGKLVSTVRREARNMAEERDSPWLIVDGPPGIGCPVIASLTGATHVLAVTEPTRSGLHDVERVLGLTRHFDIPTLVCVNKWDLNPLLADRVEQLAMAAGARALPRVRYDPTVTSAQIEAKSVVEGGGDAAQDVRELWQAVIKETA